MSAAAPLRTLATEFPGFDADSLPPIPGDWEPVHWHNDTCPSWQVAGSFDRETAVRVFVDFPPHQAHLSEHGGPRFFILRDDSDDFRTSDNWSEVLALVWQYRLRFGPPAP